MARIRPYLWVVVLVCLVTLSSAYAQGGQTPSLNGGNFGGPGMAGATGNGSGSLTGNLPTGGGLLSGNRPGGGRLGGGQGAGASLSETLSALVGQRPAAPSGVLSEGGLAALFGGSGSLAAQVNQMLETGTSWAEFGGFGTGTAGNLTLPEGSAETLNELWTSTLNSELAASLSAEINTAFAAQSAAINTATAEAQAAAQAAYDLYWQDFYAAIDTVAQEYYNMTLADAEALYQEALAAATTALDTYDESAEWYATYCLYYPWDCYNYAYDAATGVYESVEDLSQTPAGQIVMGEIDSTADTLATMAVDTFASSPEAYEAIVVFASNQLGAVVEPLYAGSLTQDIAAYIGYLPDEIAAYASLFGDVTAYWGLLRGGVAGVAIVDCATDVACVVEDLAVELSDASGGLYALDVAAPLPTSAEDALALITTAFPALNGLSFSQIMDMDEGMAFLATAFGVAADDSGQPLTVARLIYAGVIDVEGQTMVYALVAVGETEIQAFYNLFQ